MDMCSVARSGRHFEPASRLRREVGEHTQADMTPHRSRRHLAGVESHAIVTDVQHCTVIGACEADIDSAGVGVRNDITQRFLRGTVDQCLDVRGKGKAVGQVDTCAEAR